MQSLMHCHSIFGRGRQYLRIASCSKRFYHWEVPLTLVSTASFQDGDGSLSSEGEVSRIGQRRVNFINSH